jgi:hypothetical protein
MPLMHTTRDVSTHGAFTVQAESDRHEFMPAYRTVRLVHGEVQVSLQSMRWRCWFPQKVDDGDGASWAWAVSGSPCGCCSVPPSTDS